ncbi:hypothetical protein FP435_02150 [Lactobacillus sp. PV037]|nr:hypothetical protein FP433_05665 [Lactobacillus sp. PV012]QNQ84423.1 hypothetical protein FP435_02150 [Lactobacillus sp. PV037]
MSFMIILLLVIVALVILSILFAVFKFMIGLLPAAIIVAFIFWLIYRSDKNKNTISTDKKAASSNGHSDGNSKRKPARDVEIKDIDDGGDDNG